MRQSLIAISLFLTSVAGFAQAPAKVIHSRTQTWFGYFNQTRFTDRWGMWLDVHYRMTDDFVDRPFQFMIRPAATYFIRDNLRVNVGYVLAEHFPAEGFSTTRTEHRAWQQIWWQQKYPAMNTLQWLRLEQRFNEKVVNDVKVGGYNYTFRARYSFSCFVPLKGRELVPRTPFVAVINEIFLNFGKSIVYNTFDQNRLFAGFGYQFSSHLNGQLGYMNIYQQEASGSSYVMTHAIRLFFFHSLDLRQKE